MLTIGQLAKRFGLSRSTLLYYDSIGLLKPSSRTRAGYRLYSSADADRLELISIYRQAGLPLADIARILSSPADATGEILQSRLRALNDEIRSLRAQQRVTVRLLSSEAAAPETRALDKERWVAILEATGLSQQDMRRWHVEFERMSPEAHQDFLEALGIEPAEIECIREWAARPACEPTAPAPA